MSKDRCGKHEGENKRSETEMVMQCGENDWKRRRGSITSNENMEECGQRKKGRLKLRWSDVIIKDVKIEAHADSKRSNTELANQETEFTQF